MIRIVAAAISFAMLTAAVAHAQVAPSQFLLLFGRTSMASGGGGGSSQNPLPLGMP